MLVNNAKYKKCTMKNIFLILILVFLSLALVSSVQAGVVGGLNTINENRSYYFDQSKPLVTISSPSGSLSSRINIALTTSIVDKSPLTCSFRVTDTNLNPEVPETIYNCVSTTFSTSSDGSYIVFINATDGVYNNKTVNSTFTISASLPAVGGGGGSSRTLTILGANSTGVIDFGVGSLTITVIAPPSKTTKELVIKNVGAKDITDATITTSTSLKPYLDVNFCDINKKTCSKSVTLLKGQSGFLKVDGTFPTFESGVDGLITIESDEQKYELKTSIDRLPLYKIVDPMVNLISGNTGISKSIAASLAYILLVAFAVILAKGVTTK